MGLSTCEFPRWVKEFSISLGKLHIVAGECPNFGGWLSCIEKYRLYYKAGGNPCTHRVSNPSLGLGTSLSELLFRCRLRPSAFDLSLMPTYPYFINVLTPTPSETSLGKNCWRKIFIFSPSKANKLQKKHDSTRWLKLFKMQGEKKRFLLLTGHHNIYEAFTKTQTTWVVLRYDNVEWLDIHMTIHIKNLQKTSRSFYEQDLWKTLAKAFLGVRIVLK